MNRSFHFLRLGVMALPLLTAGCAPEASFRIYMEDLLASADRGEAIAANVAVKVPVPSLSTCQESAAKITDALQSVLPARSPGQCITEGMNNYLQFSTEVPMVSFSGDKLPDMGGRPITFVAYKTNNPTDGSDVYGLGIWMDRPIKEFEELISSSDKSLRYIPSADTPIFRIVFENDSRQPVGLGTQSAFFDGVPTIGSDAPRTLQRRDAVVIELSNVAASRVAMGSSFVIAAFVSIGPQQP